MAEGTSAAALGDVERAHRQLLQQSDLQFVLPVYHAPEPPPWMKPLIDALVAFFKLIGPVAPYIFWPVLVLVVGLVLVMIGRELMGLGSAPVDVKLALSQEGVWRPAPEAARSLLQEADRLAEQGRFVEAAHLILLRSIEDIQSRRPRKVAVSLTSRDIGQLPGLPDQARTTFVGIAETVERSLFGGRPLDRAGFAHCRQAYEAFADPGAWTAPGARIGA